MNVLVVSCGLRIHIKIIFKVEFVHISWNYKPLHVPKWLNWADSPVHRAKPISPWRARLLNTQSQELKLLWYSDILIPELHNSAYSCIWHGLRDCYILVRIFWHSSFAPLLKGIQDFCKLYDTFLNSEKTVGDALSVFYPLPVCFFTLTLAGIKFGTGVRIFCTWLQKLLTVEVVGSVCIQTEKL